MGMPVQFCWVFTQVWISRKIQEIKETFSSKSQYKIVSRTLKTDCRHLTFRKDKVFWLSSVKCLLGKQPDLGVLRGGGTWYEWMVTSMGPSILHSILPEAQCLRGRREGRWRWRWRWKQRWRESRRRASRLILSRGELELLKPEERFQFQEAFLKLLNSCSSVRHVCMNL